MRRLVAGLLLSLAAAAPAAAQRSLAIRQFDATITVNKDATVDVTETITVHFSGSWNGLYRTIPVEYHTPQGFNWTLRLDFLGATSGPEATPLKVEASRERHYMKYKVWVPGADNVTRTINLHYRAKNGLRFFADHDELYWNITGDEWDVPLEAASAVITLPAGATGLRAIAFNGAYGSTSRDAIVDTAGTTITVRMPKGLGFHEGVTAVVGWNKGLIPEPSQAARAAEFGASNWPLGIPLLVFGLMFWLWSRVGKDPSQLPVVVQYEPPAGLTPAEAGTLIDESADMRDITATVVDLAVRGHLKIEERQDEHLFGLIKKTEFVFHRLERAPDPALAPHEFSVLSGIFGGATTVSLSELENKFYKNVPGIATGIFDALVSKGLYRKRPDKVKAAWLGWSVVLGFLLVLFGALVSARLSMTPLPFFVAAGASWLVINIFGRIMPARTIKGARTLEKVLGFEEFLRRVDGERFERVIKTPEMFEKYLPYAMAFRVEKRWAHAFQDIYREPPQWYSGGSSFTNGRFDMGSFSNRLSSMSTQAATTMASAPRSSGGSGFSGGSSGGGGGGGGGGGF
ncbi:MAG: DUF2207 domain-containing protein [Gemmatimonadales bacterium]